jgi:hypothetical protein
MSFKRLMERAGIDDGVAPKKDGKLEDASGFEPLEH